MAIIAVMFASCTNSNVKNDIKGYKNQQVENISVKEISIEQDFYNYTQDYHSSVAQYSDCVHKLGNAYEIATIQADIANLTGNKDDKKEHEETLSRIENYKYVIDSLEMQINNYMATTQRGTIYVAKYKGFNKFGKKDGFYSFGVFTYNKDGSIHQYEGKDYMDLVLTAYPDAMKEAGKALKQAFGA